MSLFAHYHEGDAATRDSVNEALAGNLCRCTGYRPIVDAALAVIDGPAKDRFTEQQPARLAALEALPDGDLIVGDALSFFAAPASEDSLAALYSAHPDAVLLGGATDVGLWVTKRMLRLRKIIWLGRVAGLDGFDGDDDVQTLRAGVKLDVAAPLLAGLHPDLGPIMSRFGSMQVRASGTVGGSIANGSPIGDLAPALIALAAGLELRQGAVSRRLPLEDYFLGYGKQDRRPGEFVRALHIPRLKPHQAYRAYKVSKRFDEDISAVMAAFRFDLDGRQIVASRVAYGGMAATPKRAAATEAALAGASLDDPATWERALAAVGADFSPLTDMRATAGYRSKVASNLLKRALIEISGAAAPTRLGDLLAAE
jgi:xanthine dehydrogenase small subunit